MDSRPRPRLAVRAGRGRQIADVRHLPPRTGSSDFAKNIRLEKHPENSTAEQPQASTSNNAELAQQKVRELTEEVAKLKRELIRSRYSSKKSQQSCNDCPKLKSAQAEVDALKKRITEIVSDNQLSTNNLDKLRISSQKFDDKLLAEEIGHRDKIIELYNEKQALLVDNEKLKQKLSSAETNLLRCESFLAERRSEKTDLMERIDRLQAKNKQLCDEISSLRLGHDVVSSGSPLGAKWRSERDLSHFKPHETDTVAGRSINRYCPVCRHTKKSNGSALNEKVHFANLADSAVDSGFTDRDSSPEQPRSKLKPTNSDKTHSDEIRGMKDALHKFRVEKAVLETEKIGLQRFADQQKEELRRLRLEIADLKRGQTQLCQCQSSPVVQKFRKMPKINKTSPDRTNLNQLLKQNDELRMEIDTLKTRLETEKARYEANMSLLSAQKTKLERDNVCLLDDLDKSRSNNDALRRQLGETDERFEKLMDEIRSQSKKYLARDNCFASSTAINELQTNVSDLKSELKSAERQKAFSESKIAEMCENFDASRQENEKLRDKLSEANKKVQELEDRCASMNLKISELEDSIRMKDREIKQLRTVIGDLESEYRDFRKCLTDQESNVVKLQRELSKSHSLNEELTKSRSSLSDQHEKLKSELDKFLTDNKNLSKQLELCIDEQEKWKRATQRFKEEIASYDAMLKEKEKERLDLFAKYREVAGELRRLESVNASDEKQQRSELQKAQGQVAELQIQIAKAHKETSYLRDKLGNCESALECLQSNWQSAKCQNESLAADLAALRQELINADAFRMELVREMSEKDVEIRKLKQCVEDLGLHLELYRSQAAKEKEAGEELEQQLRAARDAQLMAQVEAQEKRDETRLFREKIGEYELKLELQGQDLQKVRTKLNKAESDLRQLKRQILEEQSSAGS